MSNFAMGRNPGGLPSYQLPSVRKPVVITAVDDIPVQIAEIYRIQSVKMPDYSRFASNVLSLPANDYTFALEQNVLAKYQAEEKKAASPVTAASPLASSASNQDSNSGSTAATAAPHRAENTMPLPIQMSSGALLRPSAASVTPSGSMPDRFQPRSSALSNNEWADFERSHDLFDDMELKSIDDRHELARVLFNNNTNHQQVTDSASSQLTTTVVANSSPAIASLVDDHKKLSLSDNNLASVSSAPSTAQSQPRPTLPAASGPFYSSASDLPKQPQSASSTPRPLQDSTSRSSPPIRLTPTQTVAVSSTAAMGFDHQLCSRLAHALNIDSEEVLANAVLAYSSLTSSGHSAENTERALVAVGGDERKARNAIEAATYLEQFGFTRDRIYAAVSSLANNQKSSSLGNSDELREKLLDMLATENSL